MSVAAVRVLIADDEPLARRGIRQLLSAHGDVAVVGEARNGPEAVRLLQALKPDLVFLDIQMPELDGFRVLEQLAPEAVPVLVFVTAFDGFALKAFDVQAMDYLVKPVGEARFAAALQRARERLRFKGRADPLAPRTPDAPSAAADRWLCIPTANGERMLALADVSWIEAYDYYAVVHANGERHLLRESLKSLEARLAESGFVRCHRAALVNLAHVREIAARPGVQPSLVMADGSRPPLSRRLRPAFAKALRRRSGRP